MTPGPGAVTGSPAHIVHHLEEVMGTIVVIDVYAAAAPASTEGGAADAAAGRAGLEIRRRLAEAVAILRRADETFSTWKPDSPVSRLRRGELSRAQAPAEMAEILDLCAVARDLSGGWFDPWAVPGGFDPSGYVKGWAAQNALAAFRTSSICGVLVNAAGDIASSGGLGDGTPLRSRPREPTSGASTSSTRARGGRLRAPPRPA